MIFGLSQRGWRRREHLVTQHGLKIDQPHFVTPPEDGISKITPTCRTEINWVWVISMPRCPRTAETEPSDAV